MKNEEIEKAKNFIDMFLDMFGGDDAPVDFQIMKIDKSISETFKKIMLNERFLKLEDENILKQTLLKFQKESEIFLKDLLSKIEEKN